MKISTMKFATQIKTYDDENLEFDKIYLKYGSNPYIKEFCNFMKDIFSFIDYAKGGWEMVSYVHSKATGIDFFLKYFDINNKNSFTFGDSNKAYRLGWNKACYEIFWYNLVLDNKK